MNVIVKEDFQMRISISLMECCTSLKMVHVLIIHLSDPARELLV